MRVSINGETTQIEAGTLAALLEQLGHTGPCVATAVNGEFAPARRRGEIALQDGDAIDIVSPRQGG